MTSSICKVCLLNGTPRNMMKETLLGYSALKKCAILYCSLKNFLDRILSTSIYFIDIAYLHIYSISQNVTIHTTVCTVVWYLMTLLALNDTLEKLFIIIFFFLRDFARRSLVYLFRFVHNVKLTNYHDDFSLLVVIDFWKVV